MKVVLSDAAIDSLIEIGRHIAKDSPQRALTFVSELEAKCLSLGEVPRAYPIIDLPGVFDVRRCVHGNYLILYRIAFDHVRILHVLHSAQDYLHWGFDPN